MFELLSGSRIFTYRGEDANGVAKEIAERIEVVYGHDTQSHPALTFLPRHPVGDRSHVDTGENRIAKVTAIENTFTGADGLVVAHVLIDGESNVGSFAKIDDAFSLFVVHAEGLLRKDPADVVLAFDDLLNDLKLDIGGNGDVDNLDIGVIEKRFVGLVRGRNLVSFGNGLSILEGLGGDGNRIESSLAIGNEVAVGHDESGTNTADAEGLVLGHWHVVVESCRHLRRLLARGFLPGHGNAPIGRAVYHIERGAASWTGAGEMGARSAMSTWACLLLATMVIGLLILFATAASVLIVIGTFGVAHILAHPPRRTLGNALARGLPADPVEGGAKGYEEVALVGKDGKERVMWAVEGDFPGGPTVVMLHGWGDSRFGLQAWLGAYKQRASRLVLFDSRAHGESKFEFCTWGVREKEDVSEVVDWLIKKGFAESVVLAGFSMGASVALQAAKANVGKGVDGIILDSPYLHPKEAIRGTMRGQRLPTWPIVDLAWGVMCMLWGELRRASSCELVKNVKRPILILHGEDDAVTPMSSARSICNAADDVELVGIEEAGHLQGACVDFRRYAKAVGTFLDRVAGERGNG